MATTTLLVELLIIGLQTLIWVSLFVFSVFGWSWLSHIYIQKVFEHIGVFFTIILIALAYVLGIMFDEIYARCTRWLEKHAWNVVCFKEPHSPTIALPVNRHDAQSYIFVHFPEATTLAELGAMRTRVRILRSSVFNVFLIAVSALVFLWLKNRVGVCLKSRLTWFIGIAGVLLISLTAFVFYSLWKSYWRRVRELYLELHNGP